MDPQQSLKVVKVISIIDIIYGGIAILAAIMSAVSSAAVAGLSPEELQAMGVNVEGTGISVVSVFVILAVSSAIMGLLMIFCGFFGLKATDDNSKIEPLWVLSLILLIIACLNLVFEIINGGIANIWTNLISLGLTGFMFYSANNLKLHLANTEH